MKNAVLIKSFQNGLTVYLDDTIEFDRLLEEIEIKFKESGTFFKDARLALSLEGRVLSADEERLVVDAVCRNSELDIACLIGRDEEKNQTYLRALQQVNSKQDKNDGQFYKGNLKNGQMLETESSIIVLGDIYPGSSIISAKDIIVLGGLYGEAYAGANGESDHYIVALEMAPERMRIGDEKYKSGEKSKWSIKPKIHPKIAYMKNNRIVIEPITKELLSDIPF